LPAPANASASTPTSTSRAVVSPKVLVRVDQVGGYLPYELTLNLIPTTLLVDTKMYIPGAVVMIYPGPAINPVEERTVRASVASSRARALYNTLVSPKGGWGNPPVADVPTSKITVTVDGKTRRASIPALGITATGPGMNQTQAAARTRVQNALNAINMLSGTSRMYKPRQLEAWLYDPQTGMFFDEAPQQQTLPWPNGVTSNAGCNVMAADLIPAGANQASRFRAGDNEFRVSFRPVLPTERACSRR
jgi:hypothetical protein